MWGCLSLARRCDCRQPWSAARRREMDRCIAWCRLPARHRRLLIHLMNQHRHRRSSVCRNMCVTADLQVLGGFGDGDVGVVSTQLQQRLSVDTNGLCATLREVLGDYRYESLTAIPRPEPTRCSCRTGSEGRWPGPVGTAVLRPNDVSPNLIRRGAFAQRSGRAGGPSVGAQYLRDGDVVALEFTGVAGGGAVYGWG